MAVETNTQCVAVEKPPPEPRQTYKRSDDQALRHRVLNASREAGMRKNGFSNVLSEARDVSHGIWIQTGVSIGRPTTYLARTSMQIVTISPIYISTYPNAGNELP